MVETWLDDKILDGELGLNDYLLFRCDRSPKTSLCSRGGGVLIAVKNSLCCSKVIVSSHSVEQIFVELTNGSHSTILGAVYLPPATPEPLYEEHCRSVSEVLDQRPNSFFYICGDYNLPHVDWIYQDATLDFTTQPLTTSSEAASAGHILETFNFFNSNQFNSIPNSHGKTLDLVFSNNNAVVVAPSIDSLLPCDNYHPAHVFYRQFR